MSGATVGTMVFSHGLHSSPNAIKIQALRPIADEASWQVLIPDYQSSEDPAVRIKLLLEQVEGVSGPLVLVGSSLGGVISVLASQQCAVQGLFLMAPAVYWPGFDVDYRTSVPVVHIVHGWRDDVVQPAWVLRFAEEQKATLHMLDDDHMLKTDLPQLQQYFRQFVNQLQVG